MERNQFIGNFYRGTQPVKDGPVWGLSFKSRGSMRFRWNETNQNRIDYLAEVAQGRDVCSIELIHSKIVYDIQSKDQLELKQGDGIITANKNLLPVVTVADCMPIYLFDKKKEVFGVLHSGWKGTGIVEEAVNLCKKNYGSRIDDIYVSLGPHIKNCCYIVDEERAQYFKSNFGENCVTLVQGKYGIFFPGDKSKGEGVTVEKGVQTSGRKYKLSLLKANLNVLKKCGIPDENIVYAAECTCCTPELGSFRRETNQLPADMSLEEKQKQFTPMAAWIRW